MVEVVNVCVDGDDGGAKGFFEGSWMCLGLWCAMMVCFVGCFVCLSEGVGFSWG